MDDMATAFQIVALALGILIFVSIVVAAMMWGIHSFLRKRESQERESRPE